MLIKKETIRVTINTLCYFDSVMIMSMFDCLYTMYF